MRARLVCVLMVVVACGKGGDKQNAGSEHRSGSASPTGSASHSGSAAAASAAVTPAMATAEQCRAFLDHYQQLEQAADAIPARMARLAADPEAFAAACPKLLFATEATCVAAATSNDEAEGCIAREMVFDLMETEAEAPACSPVLVHIRALLGPGFASNEDFRQAWRACMDGMNDEDRKGIASARAIEEVRQIVAGARAGGVREAQAKLRTMRDSACGCKDEACRSAAAMEFEGWTKKFDEGDAEPTVLAQLQQCLGGQGQGKR